MALCNTPFDLVALCNTPFDLVALCNTPFDLMALCNTPFDLTSSSLCSTPIKENPPSPKFVVTLDGAEGMGEEQDISDVFMDEEESPGPRNIVRVKPLFSATDRPMYSDGKEPTLLQCLTHWPLGDLDAILKMKVSVLFH